MDEVITTISCQVCGKPTSFERTQNDQPPEGDKCDRCGAWLCIDCIDWEFMADKQTERVYCRKCGNELQ